MASLLAGSVQPPQDASVIVRYNSSELAIGVRGNVIIVTWGAKPTVALLSIVDEHFDLLVRHFTNQKMVVLVDIEGESGMPDKATQHKQDHLLKKYAPLLAGCAVILPTGNKAVGLMISAWGFFMAKVVDAMPITATTSREGALKWIAERASGSYPADVAQAVKILRAKM